MAKSRKTATHDGGYTLTELLVVLIILGLITAAIAPRVMGRLDSSKIRAAKLQMETLSAAVDMYVIDTGEHPKGDAGLDHLVQNVANNPNWQGPYVRSSANLMDPWGNPFQIRESTGAGYQIVTLGADGTAGGDGNDQDLVFPDFGEGAQPS